MHFSQAVYVFLKSKLFTINSHSSIWAVCAKWQTKCTHAFRSIRTKNHFNCSILIDTVTWIHDPIHYLMFITISKRLLSLSRSWKSEARNTWIWLESEWMEWFCGTNWSPIFSQPIAAYAHAVENDPTKQSRLIGCLEFIKIA